MRHAPDRAITASREVRASLRPGARIANARGVPGTLGCVALTLDTDRLVVLTSHHVLFDTSAREEPVWIETDSDPGPLQRLARARHGRCGLVSDGDRSVHVDCAIAELDDERARREWRAADDAARVAMPLTAGERVAKTGAATGTTHGIVVDIDCSERASVRGRDYETRGQILVRPVNRGDTFTALGDSGALLSDENGLAVGLLWGRDARGYGLACPIAPVLRVLHIRLARRDRKGVS